jgi:glutaredoxin
MKKKFYQQPAVLFFGGALILVIALVVIQQTPAKSEYNTFAQCLTDKGVKMYGAYWCPHCKDQKELFGGSVKNITYIECAVTQTQQTQECQMAGIQSYPTWQFANGERVEGNLSLEMLAEKSGCELAKDAAQS